MFCLVTDKFYRPSWHHEEIAKALTKVYNGEIDRLLITLPPRHGKSELATIKFPAWAVGKNQRLNIITSSYSGDLAVDFGRKVRNLVDSDPYKMIFKTKLAEDSKSASIWHTQEGGAYVATGVGGAITGKGAHIFIIDDPIKNREEAESQVIRDKVWDWYTSVVYTRLEERGAIVLISTRWHDDDLVGRLLKQQGKDKWHCLNFPALAENDERHRRAGEPLWPAKYTREDLLRIKDNIGPYDWSALYQQRPTGRESQEFKPDWVEYYQYAPQNLTVFMTVDPAISKSDSACNSAIVVCGVDSQSNLYVLDYLAEKLDPGELIEEIMVMAREWKPQRVGIETVSYQKAVCYYLEREMEKQNLWLDVHELKHTKDKNMRIRSLVPFFRHKKVFFKKEHKELLDELFAFPNGAKVDIVDALSMQLEILYLPDGTPVKENQTPYASDPDSPWFKRMGEKAGYSKIYA
jgi:predicted phage terminase large subunit-like protein